MHQMVRPFCLGCCLVPLLALPAPISAWSAPGHKIVAELAERRLSPAARQLVREIVGDEPLSDPTIATWADALRDSHTRSWHYVNIPFTAGRYDASRDCVGGCAVATIEQASAELEGNGSALRRADALRWLVHVVADIHQPMHAGDGWDRGGNSFSLRLGRRRQPTNLHRVWDYDVVAPLVRRGGASGAARALDQAISPVQAASWTGTLSPARWAEESNREARAIYEALGRRPGDDSIIALPADYPLREQARAQAALQRAGVRLAALLDRAARKRAGERPATTHP